jgi:hypothetical protein
MKTNVMTSILLLFLLSRANATLIFGEDLTPYSMQPADDRGWSHVARLGNSSSVYLANGWFISAYHVKQSENPASVTLNDRNYAIAAQSWTRLVNPSTGSGTDLVLFRSSELVDHSALQLTHSGPGARELTMIGYGKERGAPHLNSLGEVDGYFTGSANAKHWGTNFSERGIGFQNLGYGATDMYFTAFVLIDGAAQAVMNDSGGGVFLQEEGEWRLSGIMLAVYNASDPVTGQKYAGAKSKTYIGNLATYADQIEAVIASPSAIPEPSALLLCAGGAMMLLAVKRFC